MCLYESNEGLLHMAKLLCLNMNVPTSLKLLNTVAHAMRTKARQLLKVEILQKVIMLF